MDPRLREKGPLSFLYSVPPVRDRGEDTLLLSAHFRALYAAKITPVTLEESSIARWKIYTFPDNVRELRNVVIRLGAKHPGQWVGLTELEAALDSQSDVDEETIRHVDAGGFHLEAILSSWQQRYIDAALKLSRGNLSEAAWLLGINRTTLYSKIQRLSSGGSADV